MKPKSNFLLAADHPGQRGGARPLRRRVLLMGAALVPMLGACAAPSGPTQAVAPGNGYASPASSAQARWRQLEADAGGRLGVAVYTAKGGSTLHYRADERFAATSTFKALAAAGVLAQATQDKTLLARRIRYRPEDLVRYSPVTERHLADGLTLVELCAAALQYSDNTAGNLLLRQLGGPAGLTRYARSLGDPSFRLDRWETELNTAIPGDARDTCTPGDMARNVHRLLVGDALAPAARAQLVQWMLANTTGNERIRAGVPADWRVADKTGGGDYGSTNDLAVIWPETGAALALAVYFTQPAQDAKARSDVIAEATRIAVRALALRG